MPPELPTLPPLSDLLPPPHEAFSVLITNVMTAGVRAFLEAPLNTLNTITRKAITNALESLPKPPR